jgi:uncharacterized protein YndB with AHSA1/START domain
MELIRTVTTAAPVATVFRYLADFTTTTVWDPGTLQTTRLSGDGGVGTRYHNRSRFLGRETELIYVVEELVPESRVRLRGENRTVVAVDTMTFTPAVGGGTAMTYHATFFFRGAARLVAPLLAPAFRRLGDGAEAGLKEALDGLCA